MLNLKDWFKANLQGRFKGNSSFEWVTIWGTTIWLLWKWMNATIFNDQFCYPINTSFIILKFVSYYSSVDQNFDNMLNNMGDNVRYIKWIPPVKEP